MNLRKFGVIFLCSNVLAQIEFDPARWTKSVNSVETTTYGQIWRSSGVNTVRLPKCCPYGQAVGPGNCTDSSVDFQPNFAVHNHNETAFDDVPIKPELITFDTYIHNPCRSRKFPLSPDENPIILLNGSLLLAGYSEYDGIKGHEDFCIDNLNDGVDATDATVYVFVCLKEENEGYPPWVFSTYVTLITISGLLFASSAVFFYHQDVQGVHKKSFIVYAFSMSVTYFIIILMQFMSGGCKEFGLLLQFFIILSFAWLAILCFDLAWTIHYYKVKDSMDRFIIYIGGSITYSTIFLIVSLTNNLTPDIPTSFFKPQFRKTSCSNFDDVQRKGSFYTALILTIVVSIVSLLYFLIKMNQKGNSNSTTQNFEWKKDAVKLRYMYGRLLIIFVTMIVWFLDSFSDRFADNSGISTLILFIQAFQGFIVVPLFTMSTIRTVIDVNKKPRIDNLQELMEISKTYDRI